MTKIELKILTVLQKKSRTMFSQKELVKKAGLGKKDIPALREALLLLQKENKLVEQNGRYQTAQNMGLTSAEIVKVTGTFGFARPLGEETQKDVFIPGRFLKGSMPGDTVLIKQTRGTGELPEGEVIQVVKEAAQRFSGVLRITDTECTIVPDRYVKFPLPVNRHKLMGAKDGDKVLAEISRRGERHSEHRARILESFGDANSAAACCRSILAANDIFPEFPPEVLEQAGAIAAGTGIHPKELAVRTDLREETIFTIDSAHSKDLDDAVSIRRSDSGWELGVHIADVSYYVTYQTPMDKEALARGTSVYFADSVVPMLPPEISNGICSLNPGEDRLTFSALLELDNEGKLVDYKFRKTVIRSRVKGVYSEINDILAGTADAEVLRKYDGLLENIHDMDKLAALLTAKRYERGGINLESVESEIVIGPDGKAIDVLPRERGVSEQIIEEFMLLANEAAASMALEQALPFVYRIHENPSPDKIENLYGVLGLLDIKYKRAKGGVTTAQLAAILDQVRGTDYDSVVNTMVLRSMAKARYSERNVGHFGLVLRNYAHFTSPIRRYPDLTIHRILSGYVTGMRRENIAKRFGGFVAQSAAQSTQREINAMTAERECEDCYKAEYMQRFIGVEFDGIVSGATTFGAYIRLPNTVEGLLSVRDFPAGDWEFDGSITFVERVTGAKIRLGDTLHVQVAATDVSLGNIDFVYKK